MVKIRRCRRGALGLASVVLTLLSGCHGFASCDPACRSLSADVLRSRETFVLIRPRSVREGQRGGVHCGVVVIVASLDTALGVASPRSRKNWLTAALEQAFSNEHFTAPPEGVRASARHILLDSPELCQEAIHDIESGHISFEEAAHRYSTCPTKHDGGSLGSFHRGTMVPEFDALVFDPSTPLRTVVGPVRTPFGYHIVVVDKRSGV